jgi:hypothetical protein
MLLPREQSPWNCGYVLGAVALRALREAPKGRSDLGDLQRAMSELLHRPISPTQVISAAAWLYLLEAIRLDDDGTIVRCD